MPQKVYKEFEEYLEDQNESCKDALKNLRQYILEVIPDLEELFNYSISLNSLRKKRTANYDHQNYSISIKYFNKLIVRIM